MNRNFNKKNVHFWYMQVSDRKITPSCVEHAPNYYLVKKIALHTYN